MAVGRGFQGPKYDFQSQFVELPLDFMQKQLESAQKRQDEGRTLQIDLLGKKIPVHQYDVAGIEQAKQLKAGVDNTLNELSNVDFNAPGNVQRLLKARQDVAGIHGQFGPAEHLAQRAATIDASIKGLEDKELELPSYVKDRKRSQIIQAAGSTPVGKNIGTPGVTRHLDANKTVDDYVKATAAEMYNTQTGLKIDPNDPELWKTITTKTKQITPDKILQSAWNKLQADHEFQASIVQESDALSKGDKEAFNKYAGNPLIMDDAGNITGVTSSILGNAFSGVLNRAYKDIDISADWKVSDATRRANKKDEEDRNAGLIPLESTPTEILREKNASLANKLVKQTISTGSTAFASPTGLTSRASDTKYDYPELTPEEQITYNSIVKNFPGITDKDELNKKVKSVIEGIGNVPVSAYTSGYNQKQKDAATNYLFGTNKIEKEGQSIAGNYINRYIYDPETRKTMQGKDFQALLAQQPEGTRIQTVGNFNNKNPYTILTDNDAFSNSEQVSVGNKTYVVSGPAQLIDPKTGFDTSVPNKNINKINKSTYSPKIPQYINLVGMAPNDVAEILYKDSQYELSLPEYGITKIVENTPEKVYNSYIIAINKLQNK